MMGRFLLLSSFLLVTGCGREIGVISNLDAQTSDAIHTVVAVEWETDVDLLGWVGKGKEVFGFFK